MHVESGLLKDSSITCCFFLENLDIFGFTNNNPSISLSSLLTSFSERNTKTQKIRDQSTGKGMRVVTIVVLIRTDKKLKKSTDVILIKS